MKTDLFVAVSHSLELDSLLAVHEIIEDCERQFDGRIPNAGILYASIDVEFQLVLDKLYEKWPDIKLIGCTSDAEFSTEGYYCEDSLMLTLFSSNDVKFFSGYIDNYAEDINSECDNAILEAKSFFGEEPKLGFLFSEVININGETILQHMSLVSKGRIPIVGGIAADNWDFVESKQFCNRLVSSDISPYLFLSGEFDYSYGIDSGWDPVGEFGIVTKSSGNILFEIDNKPALEFYKNIFGENAEPSLELPIAIYNIEDELLYLRTSFEKHNEDGAITYLGNVPVGSKVKITMVDRNSILEGVNNSVNNAVKNFPTDRKPLIAMCFSCTARRILLGTRTIEEFRNVKSKLDVDTKIAGYYSYGEFCPDSFENLNKFHNETFVTVLLG